MFCAVIKHIGFKTNTWRVIEGGSSPGTGFSAPGRKGWKQASLHAISGWTDDTLGSFSTVQASCYSPNHGERQMWSVVKMIPSDGPILTGDNVLLPNVDAGIYLAIDDVGYLVSWAEPSVWKVVLPS